MSDNEQQDDGWTTVRYKPRKPKNKSGQSDPNQSYQSQSYQQDDYSNSTYGQVSTSFQDWKTVTLRKKPKPQKVLTQRSLLSTNKSRHMNKLDDAEDAQKLKRVSPNLSKKIRTYRAEHQLSQAELAQLMNITTNTLKEYESGKALNDMTTTQTINNFLNRKHKENATTN